MTILIFKGKAKDFAPEKWQKIETTRTDKQQVVSNE